MRLSPTLLSLAGSRDLNFADTILSRFNRGVVLPSLPITVFWNEGFF